MPTFNQCEYLKEAIESIQKQDMSDWILYIINDGSTDNTAKIVKPYISDQIKYFEKENGGPGSALNYGFKRTQGIYHTYVSSDNIYFPNYISELSKGLDTMPNVGFIYSDFQFINTEGVPGQHIIRPPYIKNMLLNGCYIGLCFMWRNKIYKKIGGFDEKYTCQDYDFALKCEEITNLYHIPKILGYYREHSKTISLTMGFDDTPTVIANARNRRKK